LIAPPSRQPGKERRMGDSQAHVVNVIPMTVDQALEAAKTYASPVNGGMVETLASEVIRLRSQLSAAAAALEAAEQAMMDHRGALVRVVMEGNGCSKHCSLEFHQWAIESMLKIAGDSLKRFAKPLPDPPARREGGGE
jgi:hypothetical protein